MKQIFLVFALFISLFAHAQFRGRPIDSITYYNQQATTIVQAYRDSLRHDSAFIHILERSKQLRSRSDNYKSFFIHSGLTWPPFRQFNADNGQSGYKPLSGPMVLLGYGFSFKKNRRIFDLNIMTAGFNKKTNNGSGDIKTSFATLFQFEWGYDFIKANNFNLYPYAGFGLRGSTLIYKGATTTNPSYTNISNIIQNNASVDESILEVGYQAGVGLEYAFQKKSSPRGTIVFLKAGTNRPFKRSIYKIGETRYDPSLKYGEFIVTFGFKFFGR